MQQTNQLRPMAARSATAFLLAVLCLYPLYIDKFSNLGVVKFTAVSTLFLVFPLWIGALALVGARPARGRLRARDPSLWALAAFVLTGLISTIFSLSPVSSLWGLGGYYGGFVMVLLTAVGYLVVRAFAPQDLLNGLTFCVGLTVTAVTVLYVLNIFNIDLIGTYEDTAVVERAQFFSTLGQKNFNAGFMAFALPLVFYAFLVARGPRHTVFYSIPAFFGGLALAVVDAEGLALGIGAAVLVLMCQKIFTTRTVRRLAVLGAFFFFHAGWMHYMREHVYTQGGTPMLAALGRVAGVGFVVCAALWVLLRFGLRGREIPLWQAGRVVAAVLVVGGLLLYALANFWPGFPSLGRLDDILIINDDWGTNRGTAWRITWCTWLDQPMWRKWIGVGTGMMHTAMVDWAGSDLTPRMNTFYAAHNEYLEQLLTTGILGLGAWLWFIVSHLRKAARNWLRPGVAPVTLALVSYLAQAVVSIRVSMIFPEIMLLFALLQVFCLPPEQEEETPAKPPRHGKAAKRRAAPAPRKNLLRLWGPPALAAVILMAVCGAASRVIFGFLF